jgi:hypothetical protein
MNQVKIISWIQFYEMIYELDEIERPTDKIIDDDKRLDMWYKNWRANIRKKLLKYHKDNNTVEKDIPKARWSMG